MTVLRTLYISGTCCTLWRNRARACICILLGVLPAGACMIWGIGWMVFNSGSLVRGVHELNNNLVRTLAPSNIRVT